MSTHTTHTFRQPGATVTETRDEHGRVVARRAVSEGGTVHNYAAGVRSGSRRTWFAAACTLADS